MSKNVAVLYQHMSPTRVPVFDCLYELLGDRLKVFYPTVLEGDRDAKWRVTSRHPHHILRSRNFAYTHAAMKRYVHVNPEVYSRLKEFNPDCVVIYGFHPTALLAWWFTRVHRKRYIVATDGCLKSDRQNSALHPLLRKMIVPTAVAAIGTSRGSLDLFNQYGDFTGRYFNCYLCADNTRFSLLRDSARQYDLMFAGQFIDRKMPHFFVDVVAEMKKTKPDVSVVMLGDGPLRSEVLTRLDSLGVHYRYAGFVPMDEVPAVYASARLFLFPSKLDAYGVVANEALAVGTPVISNDEPGAAGEVILHDQSGYVLPLDPAIWAKHALRLLSSPDLYKRFSDFGFEHIQKYTFQIAANNFADAVNYAFAHH